MVIPTFETVDYLAAHPDYRIKGIQRQCKEDRAKSVMNFACARQKPPTGVSSVIGLEQRPNNVRCCRYRGDKVLADYLLRHNAPRCGVLLSSPCKKSGLFGLTVPAITVFDRPCARLDPPCTRHVRVP